MRVAYNFWKRLFEILDRRRFAKASTLANRRGIGDSLWEVIPALLPYLFIALIILGAWTGNRTVLWLGIGCLVALFAFAVAFGLLMGMLFPLEIVRLWPTLRTREKLLLGLIAVIVALGIVLVFVAAGLLIAHQF